MKKDPNGFGGIIETDKERKRKKAEQHKVITLREYLKLVEKDPLIAQNSPSRFWEIIQNAGIEDIPEHERWFGVKKKYSLFASKLFGIDEVIHQVVNHIRVGAFKGSTGKQVLVLVGPPASGKSTVVKILMDALKNYNKRPVFVIKGCPKWEEPLHLIPGYLRNDVENEKEPGEECSDPDCKERHLHLGIKIKGDLCQHCRNLLETKYTDTDEKTVRWWDVELETFTFSIRGRRGIGSFEPSDEKSSDVTALTGRENIGITSVHGYKHPLAYELSGEIPAGERGIVEGREILACDPEVLRVFFSVAEEQELKVQGSSFPHLSVDTLVVGHTNLTVFKEFNANKKYEGLHDRFYIIPVRYPLRIRDEVRLYKKLINTESDFTRLKKCHIAPGTLELAATFAIMTRLMPSSVVSLLTKAKLYNGDKALTELRDKEKKPIDLRLLIEDGQSSTDISKREGMFGVSSRTILAALNKALVEESGTNGCLTPLNAIRMLREVFEHRMGFSAEDIERYKLLLSAGESDNVMNEYKQLVKEMVIMAYLAGYSDLARELFNKYMKEIKLYRNQKRKMVRGQLVNIERDPESGKVKEPDLKFIRSIEEHIPWTTEEAEVGRGELLEYKDEDFSYETYPPLAKACDKKLLNDSKDTLTLVLSSDRPKEDTDKKRQNDLFNALLDKYDCCPKCAKEFLERGREFLRE